MNSYELARIIGGKLKGQSIPVYKFSIDSRNIKKGEVFIAIRGSRFDGHDFINDAFQRGAIGVISEKEINPPEGKFAIRVNSSIESLKKIAKYKREKFKGKVVGVAGSAGKTTTKELIAHLLAVKGKVYKTPGNLNSQIGLPLAVANAPLNVDFWVLELGASRLGEVKKLTHIVLPHIRVITSLGEEHLEGFGSFENVIRGNGEIFEYWLDDSIAVIPTYAQKYYSYLKKYITIGKKGDIKGNIKNVSLKGIKFEVEKTEFFIPVVSLGIFENTLCAFGVLKALGYDFREFKERLKSFKQTWGRMEVIKFNHLILINDAYNSNPLSLKNAIETISLIDYDKKILVLGDMLELGEYSKKLHEDVGSFLNTKDFFLVVFIGKEMRHAYEMYKGKKIYFSSKQDFKNFVVKSGNTFKDGLILIKGSRGMALEELIPVFREVS